MLVVSFSYGSKTQFSYLLGFQCQEVHSRCFFGACEAVKPSKYDRRLCVVLEFSPSQVALTKQDLDISGFFF